MHPSIVFLIIATFAAFIISIALQICGYHDAAMFMISVAIFDVLWLIYGKLNK